MIHQSLPTNEAGEPEEQNKEVSKGVDGQYGLFNNFNGGMFTSQSPSILFNKKIYCLARH